MNTHRILTQAQAEAVYSAMCALNKVGGRIHVTIDESKRVAQRIDSRIHVLEFLNGDWEPCEVYLGQSAFAAAYGLDHGDEYPNAVAAAAGGLTQTAIER